MRKLMMLGLVLAIALAGCKKPEPPPEDLPPPPPTADELYAQMRAPLEVLFSAGNSGASITNAQRNEAVNGLRPIHMRMAAEPNGQPAKQRMQRDLEDLVKLAVKNQSYRVVKGAIEAFKLFAPGEKKFDADEEYADLVLARPSVKITGFFKLDGEPVVFLDVTDADDASKKETYKVREGENFHEVLQLLRVIGNNQGIELLYIPIDQKWVVNSD
ncbi:MAG: hypothetical protein GC168_18055 [Candidatus Hydrogenedens sp.]|nr:hypothetical protein [Candidatus Hydrogenedens sp.]